MCVNRRDHQEERFLAIRTRRPKKLLYLRNNWVVPCQLQSEQAHTMEIALFYQSVGWEAKIGFQNLVFLGL